MVAEPSSGKPVPKPAVVQHLTMVEGLLAGGVAGAVAKTVIAPFDRVKIIFQVDAAQPYTVRAAFRTGVQIFRTGGVLHLWRGNGANLVRVMPQAAITFMTYDRYEALILRLLSENSVLTRFLAGAAAGGTAAMLTYPLDLLRAKMAVEWAKKMGYVTVIRNTVATSGVRGLFFGLSPTMLGILPYSGLGFAIFHTLKSSVKRARAYASDADIPVPLRLSLGAFAGFWAQTFTYPLDVVRRRMQVHGTIYPSVVAAFASIYRTEGLVKGLYKGISMNWVKGPLSVAVSFAVNDYIKSWLRSQK